MTAFLRLMTVTRPPYKKEAPLSAARAGPRESAGNLRAGEAPGGTRARPDVKTTPSRKTCAETSTLRSVNIRQHRHAHPRARRGRGRARDGYGRVGDGRGRRGFQG